VFKGLNISNYVQFFKFLNLFFSDKIKINQNRLKLIK